MPSHDLDANGRHMDLTCKFCKGIVPAPFSDDRATLAALLAEHQSMHLQAAQGPNGLVWECCNEIVGPYELEGEELEAAYRSHLAAVIADSESLRARAAAVAPRETKD